ncbi:response regulator transcription factor [Alkaliphilus serpentinus]|uniref:Stage 0 sporulation protein A homolog n=1 Tax=Alkaliphilus serpentinus TaxID=1482731 RepID=A0A833HMF7_9FIRM|nr:response regulator transcription factor [Alkaliphilus serpentinus]KAB3527447.1 response regulator transcription factor [Alkaliphilus serpentinus]
MAEKILIVDDEQGIVTLLKDYFELNGYTVLTAMNGTEALQKVAQKPDIILLDINMPDINGIEVCSKIREHVSCPILFLTAKIEEKDKINGFRVGGDDYIVKPFSVNELAARVAAHLRREHRNTNKTTAIFAKDLVIDYGQRCVYFNNQPIQLAKKEFDIVELLSMNAGQVFDKERIYEKIWGYDSDGDSNVVTEHIRRIRSKLVSCSLETYIETVWGVGYKWIK